MDWIMIAIVGGSILVSGHPSEEACLGRAAIVKRDQKVEAKCVQAPRAGYAFGSSGSAIYLGDNHDSHICYNGSGYVINCQ